ncbi:MAG: hypothetical protein M1831_003665 [Alyxoria varia]|nr:MAG: hypothetical protein M1831_003665 [Alyxoria varia]
MNARTASRIVFRIVYSSSYTLLFFAALVAFAVTPGDHIYQTVSNGRYGNIFVVSITLVVTAIIALFIYAGRLYTNRTTLATIPRPYIPIEEGEIGKKVRKMIIENRQRSALIAWESRPRVITPQAYAQDAPQDEGDTRHPLRRKLAPRRKNDQVYSVMSISAESPPWGNILHPGWSSPATEELPDLHFETVLAELSSLIEAKAVSLAPPDPAFGFVSSAQDEFQAPPDPEVVAVLQRPPTLGMRDYVEYLQTFGVIDPPELVALFLSKYEHARFSTFAITEAEFRDLLDTFSKLLAGMNSLDLALLQKESDKNSSQATPSISSQGSVIIHGENQNLHSPSVASLQSARSAVRHEVA